MNTFRARLPHLPIDSVTDFEGERIYLNRFVGGSELGVYVMDFTNGQQLMGLLENGFVSALEFDGGLALSADGSSLVLTQWLPHVSSWAAAERSLEKLLRQAAVLRACEESEGRVAHVTAAGSVEEQRFRRKLIAK